MKDRALFRVVAAAGKAPPSLDAMKNPGVHITPSFCSSTEETAVVAEAMQVIRDYGISHVAPEHVNFFERQQNHLTRPPTVNMQRVTGRDEEQPWIPERQKRAPWGYGASFDLTQVPPAMANLAHRIAETPNLSPHRLGPLRDITINFRQDYYFRLDPHLDPLDDGGNVFVLGLLSPTVVTLSPLGAPMATMMDQRRAATQSWAPGEDLDCLVEAGSLLHLYGEVCAHRPARSVDIP